ncbi:hypothetical protein V8D89_011029 [Ganoderma adspersum]
MDTSSPKLKTRFVECVRHFTPSWFAAITGTGAVGLLWHNFPYAEGSTPMLVFTYIFFFLNLFLFLLFNVVTAIRYFMFPRIWLSMIHHPTQSLFLATYPMSVSTLVNVAVVLLYQQGGFGGKGFLYTLWAFWWFDLFLSALSAYGIVHLMFTRQKHTLESITAGWVLPILPLLTCAGTGGILAAPLLEFAASKSLTTLAVATVCASMGLALAFMLLALYLLRLILHGPPRGPGVVSVYIPLGPIGQGGYDLLLLGAGYDAVLPLPGNATVLGAEGVGMVVRVVVLVVALALWAVGTMWLLYGLLATADVLWHDHVHFKQAFWSLLYPNGIYANLCIQLYRATDATFFRMYGAVYGAATLAVWVAVFARTVMLVYSGAMFRAPCIDDVDIHATALEKDAKEKHASCVLSAMEGAEANGEGPEGVGEELRLEGVRIEFLDARRREDVMMSAGSSRLTVV